jgi:SAM-dependent methyltransferase
MDAAEFDKFADEYAKLHGRSVAASGETPEFFAEYKVRDVRRHFDARPALRSPSRILDFGTGVGVSIPWFAKHFPDAALTGVDVSRRSLDVARGRFPGLAELVQFDGETLPFEAGRFDLVFAACVFHHIDHGRHLGLLREIARVLAPGGLFFVFEHNPHNPLTRHAVRACPFDDNAVLIGARSMRARMAEAGFGRTALRYRIFVPGFLRRLRPLEAALAWCPLGAQYGVRARRAGEAAAP